MIYVLIGSTDNKRGEVESFEYLVQMYKSMEVFMRMWNIGLSEEKRLVFYAIRKFQWDWKVKVGYILYTLIKCNEIDYVV